MDGCFFKGGNSVILMFAPLIGTGLLLRWKFASTGANSFLHMLASILGGLCRPERQTGSRKICPYPAGAWRLGGRCDYLFPSYCMLLGIKHFCSALFCSFSHDISLYIKGISLISFSP